MTTEPETALGKVERRSQFIAIEALRVAKSSRIIHHREHRDHSPETALGKVMRRSQFIAIALSCERRFELPKAFSGSSLCPL